MTQSSARRVGRSGRDVIDHPPGRAHDDVINAAAGALLLAAEPPGTVPPDSFGAREIPVVRLRNSDLAS